MPRRFSGRKREIGGVESAKSRQSSKSLDPSGGANRVCCGNGLSPQLSQQPSLHPVFGSFPKGIQRLIEWRSTRPFLSAFRGRRRASQLLLLFAYALVRRKAENRPNSSFCAHIDKRAATTKNAVTTPSESFSRPHEKGQATSRPGTGNPSARTQKKRPNQPPDVIFQPFNRPM